MREACRVSLAACVGVVFIAVMTGCGDDATDRPLCGDGVVATGEQCDPPDGASCSTNCQFIAGECGDGTVDPDEFCDDGNTTSGDGCRGDCLSDETCGNGTVDWVAGEQCDPPDDVYCDSECQPIVNPACGDGNEDPGEVCDDGNHIDGDGCSADCLSDESCGNGVVDVVRGEECDDASENSDMTPDACRSDCTAAGCGDGVIDSNEVCDDGNTSDGDGCRGDCLSDETCGNGVLDPGEACDDGDNDSGDGCRADCRSDESCGNGIVDAIVGEVCDDATANSNSAPDACRMDCSHARCGDGATDTGEVCDDGDNDSGDGCRGDCLSNEQCGNGLLDTAAGEQCDDGQDNNDAEADACRTDCKSAHCGDNVLDSTEECDPPDGGATCDASCQPTRVGEGEPCTADASCLSDSCLAEAVYGQPGGLCATDNCLSTPCPVGSACLDYGATGAFCFPTCNGDADCRSGFYCTDIYSTSEPICFANCNNDSECPDTGTCDEWSGACDIDDGLARDGESCTGNADCESGYCLTGTDWPGGFCASFCSREDSLCPGDGNCFAMSSYTHAAVCIDGCTSSVECRSGYWCNPGNNSCWANSRPDGSACSVNTDCDSGRCLDEVTSGLPGGMCVTDDCLSTPCQSGFDCVDHGGGDSVCFPSCAVDANCRSGYYCTDVFATPNPICSANCNSDTECPDSGACNEWSGDCAAELGLALDGAACTADASCEGGECIQGSEWPEGYCTSLCSLEDNLCPGDGVCLDHPDYTIAGRCLDGCTSSPECRTGYACSPSSNVCLPVEDGSPCTTNTDCASGVCLDEVNFGLPGGLCVTDDCLSTPCPSGSECLDYGASGAFCFPSCAGNADCREGFSCHDLFGTPNPICFADCIDDAECVDTGTCNQWNGYCTAVLGLALDGEPCTAHSDCESNRCFDEATYGTPGGYCYSYCSADSMECPGDGHCALQIGLTQTLVCMDGCATVNDCRAGYSCTAGSCSWL
jgi:cysteine-rich repeat protein